jgi:competence protein ComEA
VGSSPRPATPLAYIIGTCTLLVSMQHASEATVPAAPSGNGTVNGSNMLPAAPEREVLVRVCTSCHAPELVVSKHHTPEEWDDIIAKMVDHGAQATDEEQQRILSYLVRFFGPQT